MVYNTISILFNLSLLVVVLSQGPSPNNTTPTPQIAPPTIPQPAPLPSPSNISVICKNLQDCPNCAYYSECVWCATTSNCWPGGGFGPSGGVQCDDWRWKQCSVSGMIVAIILGVAALVILLILLSCHFYKTFYKSSKVEYEKD